MKVLLFVALAAIVASPAAAQPAAPPDAPPAESTPAASAADVASLRAELEQLKAAMTEQQVATEAERMALLDMITTAQTPTLEEPKLQLYGFMDMGLFRYLLDELTPRGIFPTDAWSFVSGNTNLYIDARPTPSWRALIETRLTLLPHGIYLYEGLGAAERYQNRGFDLTSASGRNQIQWGSIIIERAQMEWTLSSKLKVTAGHFLTPWGIWNVDHGTPTLISLMLPSFQVEDAVPQHLTGIQLSGSLQAPPWEVGYAAHLTNGRTATLFDLTNDKAIGGRVFVRVMGDATLTVGGSGYYGRSEDEVKSLSLSKQSTLLLDWTLTTSFREWTAGGDISLDWGGLRLRSEAAVRHIRYDRPDDPNNPASIRRPDAYGVPGTKVPDHYEHFAYGTLAYRLGPIEPYVYLEIKDSIARTAFLPDDAWARSAGLNIYLSASAQLKLQYVDTFFTNRSGDYKLQLLLSRLVLAF